MLDKLLNLLFFSSNHSLKVVWLFFLFFLFSGLEVFPITDCSLSLSRIEDSFMFWFSKNALRTAFLFLSIHK